MPRGSATRSGSTATGYRNRRHAQPAVSALHGGRRGVVCRYHQSLRSGFRVGGVARRADGTVDHRQPGALPTGRVPCGGRCIYAAQWAPVVRSAVDATDGIDLGLPVLQGTAATGPALPAVQFHVRILFAVGHPTRTGLGEGASDKLGPGGFSKHRRTSRVTTHWATGGGAQGSTERDFGR